MKKFFKIIGGLLIAILFVGTFVFLYRKSQPQETVYDICQVDTATIKRVTIVTGTIEPRNEVAIKPQISGIIAELYKEAGQIVKHGEVIAKVKVIPDMPTLNAAESRVRLAKMVLKQAETDFERAQKLFADQLIAAEEFEQAQLALKRQREELDNANDALQIAREGVSASTAAYSTTLIRSTIDGLILDIPVKVGNSVVMSNSFNDGTTIATVANMNDLIFRGHIDETEVERLVKGMDMNISIGAMPDRNFHARLEFIAPQVNKTSNSANQFEIRGAFENRHNTQIRSGYSANAEVLLEHLDGVTAVPESCVEFSGDSTFVHVLTSKPETRPQTFERRRVSTGLSDGVKIHIKKGLKKGERIRGNQQP